MPQIYKHILTIITAILLAYAFVPAMRNNGVAFDPIDANDFAVMKQKTTTDQYQNDIIAGQKELTANSDHKHHRKYKLVHSNFQIAISLQKHNFLAIGVSNTHRALKQKRYRHLYYRDINPPPRYS